MFFSAPSCHGKKWPASPECSVPVRRLQLAGTFFREGGQFQGPHLLGSSWLPDVPVRQFISASPSVFGPMILDKNMKSASNIQEPRWVGSSKTNAMPVMVHHRHEPRFLMNPPICDHLTAGKWLPSQHINIVREMFHQIRNRPCGRIRLFDPKISKEIEVGVTGPPEKDVDRSIGAGSFNFCRVDRVSQGSSTQYLGWSRALI